MTHSDTITTAAEMADLRGPEQASSPPTAGESRARSLVQSELSRIADRFDAANRLLRQAKSTEDREFAEAMRRDAAGQFWAFGQELADLLLLLIRMALSHRRDALGSYLADALRPELAPIVAAVARLEDALVPTR